MVPVRRRYQILGKSELILVLFRFRIKKIKMGIRNGKNIVYHFPNKIYRNMLRVSLTEKMLTKRLTRVFFSAGANFGESNV